MPFSTRQQKLDKLGRGYKIVRPRPAAQILPGRVPGGADTYAGLAAEENVEDREQF